MFGNNYFQSLSKLSNTDQYTCSDASAPPNYSDHPSFGFRPPINNPISFTQNQAGHGVLYNGEALNSSNIDGSFKPKNGCKRCKGDFCYCERPMLSNSIPSLADFQEFNNMENVAKYGSQVLKFENHEISGIYFSENFQCKCLTSHPLYMNYSVEELRRIDRINRQNGVMYPKSNTQVNGFSNNYFGVGNYQFTNEIVNLNQNSGFLPFGQAYNNNSTNEQNPVSFGQLNSPNINKFSFTSNAPVITNERPTNSSAFTSNFSSNGLLANLSSSPALIGQNQITQPINPTLIENKDSNNMRTSLFKISDNPGQTSLFGNSGLFRSSENPGHLNSGNSSSPLFGGLFRNSQNPGNLGNPQQSLFGSSLTSQSPLFSLNFNPSVSQFQTSNNYQITQNMPRYYNSEQHNNNQLFSTFDNLKQQSKMHSQTYEFNDSTNPNSKEASNLFSKEEEIDKLLKTFESQIRERMSEFNKNEKLLSQEENSIYDKISSNIFLSNPTNTLKRSLKSIQREKSFFSSKNDRPVKSRICTTTGSLMKKPEIKNSPNFSEEDQLKLSRIEIAKPEEKEHSAELELKLNVIIMNFDIIFEVNCSKLDTVKDLKSEIVSMSKSIDSLVKVNYLFANRKFLVLKLHNILKGSQILQDLNFENGDIIKILIMTKEYDEDMSENTQKKLKGKECMTSKHDRSVENDIPKIRNEYNLEESPSLQSHESKKPMEKIYQIQPVSLVIERFSILLCRSKPNFKALKPGIKRRYNQHQSKYRIKRRYILIAKEL